MNTYHRSIVSQEPGQPQGETKLGYIFDIQRFSINDGPGIRTTVFFKGCPLRCIWCDNPESQEQLPQLLYFESLCTKCYRCVEVCPSGATKISPDGSIEIDHGLCQACGLCVKACLSEVRVISGKTMTVDEVVEVVRKDELFYRNSGGGVTASGGEPTYQPDFLKQLFRQCQSYGIHTTLDTCGYVKWEVMAEILDYVDLVYYDLKHMDTVRHGELTGVGNELILDNARRISQGGKPIVMRIPLIPGCNDSEEKIKAMAEFVTRIKVVRVDIVPFHQLGSKKYERLGMTYRLGEAKPYQEDEIQTFKDTLESYGLEVSIA
ncbi:MAG: glycyl-radical enzyme activating protein [Dehalococcoidales bacterium]